MYAARNLAAVIAHRLGRRGAYAWAAWRAFWLVMLVGHAPALVAAVAGVAVDGAGLVRLALLAGSCVLFALKAADVAWLRLPTDRRTLTAVTAVIVLLHAGVLLHTARVELPDISIPLATQAAGAAVTLGLLTVALRRDRRSRASRALPKHFDDWSHVLARLTATLLVPRFLCLARASLSDRAPPRRR